MGQDFSDRQYTCALKNFGSIIGDFFLQYSSTTVLQCVKFVCRPSMYFNNPGAYYILLKGSMDIIHTSAYTLAIPKCRLDLG